MGGGKPTRLQGESASSIQSAHWVSGVMSAAQQDAPPSCCDEFQAILNPPASVTKSISSHPFHQVYILVSSLGLMHVTY